MKLVLQQDPVTEAPTDLLVLACFANAFTSHPYFETYNTALQGQLEVLISDNEWTGKFGQIIEVSTLGQSAAKRIALLGLGNKETLQLDTFRKAAARAVKHAKNSHATSVIFALPQGHAPALAPATVGQAVTEGAYLANYQFESYARDKSPAKPIESFAIVPVHADPTEYEAGISVGVALSEGVNLARDLVNTPPNKMTPTVMAQTALAISERHGMSVEIFDRPDLEKLGMGSFLAVAQGSLEPPKMIVLRYQGRSTWDDVIGFVGKGITFDSGGLSIKTAAGMENMKTDMGGGASVLGAMEAIGRLQPKVNVVGVIAATENMPSGSAFRPGDVIQAMTGQTIEVLNTDAEGRLVLADAVAYAKHHGASKLIDLATLTGAALVALGTTTTAAMTNNDEFLAQFFEAARNADEKVWQLPTFDEYRDLIKSDIADVKNIGGRFAGSITAGLFIETFVEGTPWIHLDIAGTAYSDEATPIGPKGATGVMVRSLVGYAAAKAE